MAFNSKDDAINNLNSNITNSTEPHLTPVGVDNRVRATNLKNFFTELLDWIFPNTGVSLKGKSPIITDNNTDYGSISWIQIVPIGTVMPWAGASASPPDGYLFCDGSTVSDSTYADLFATIGNNYGTAPSGQFRLPNLEGSVPLGFDTGTPTTPNVNPSPTQSNYGKVGNTGGKRNVPLTSNEMPSHRHNDGTYATNTKGSHSHRFYRNNDSGGNFWSASIFGADNRFNTISRGSNRTAQNNGMENDGSHSHDVTGWSGFTGGGNAHENRMPYVVMKYIIKT